MTRLGALLVLLAPVLFAHPAAAWWKGDWSFRSKVTVDAGPNGANVTQPIGRTQILLRLTPKEIRFEDAKENGEDFRVVAADDKTPLHYHIEKWDGLVDQQALVWVDVPDLAPGAATSFYIYWGNKAAVAGDDAKATYDPDTMLVYHFAAENGLPKDYTAYTNNALTGGTRADGEIGFGLKLDGKANPVQIPASASLAFPAGQAMTWSVWETLAPGADGGVLFSTRDGASLFSIGIDHGVAYAELTTAAGTQRSAAGDKIAADGWHQVVVTAADKLTVYVDGVPHGELAASLPALAGAATLGGTVAAPAPATPAPAADATTPNTPATPAPAVAPAPAAAGADTGAAPAAAAAAVPNLAGSLDEFQISKVARPVGAVQIDYASEGLGSAKLLAFGPTEEGSLLGNGYFAVIVKSVTIDAWVVIGILGVMALISWIVMVGKAVYIARTGAANRAFRAEFRKMLSAHTDDPRSAFSQISAKGKPRLRRSTLFRLYDVGAHELHERLHDGRLGPDGLIAPQSMAAIRAALDAQLSIESQRLNRLMVLLTIAISGGPFLGLFGTVVGVMITFAAIAQAGDVNVNSIAPGISAALLATVTGLAVAIPALFGYNYFVTRIREVSIEMQVFVEDLVTRIGEGFRGAAAPTIAARDAYAGGQVETDAKMQALVDALLVRMSETLRLRGLPQPGE